MTTVAKPIQGIATAHSRNQWVLGCITAVYCALDVPDFRPDRTARLATGACVKFPKPGSFPISGHQRSGMGSRVHQFEAVGIWAGKAQTLRHALYPPAVSKQLSRPLRQPYSLLQTTQGHGGGLPNLERHVVTSPRSSSLFCTWLASTRVARPALPSAEYPRKTAPTKRDAAQQSSIDGDAMDE